MKRILILFLFISSLMQAQYAIKGTVNPVKKYSWVLLYKVEGARQVFIKNTQVKKEVQKVNGKDLTVGSFEFELPADAKTGSYRITYDLQKNGFVDFLFNQENVTISFNPDDVQGSTVFQESKENQLFSRFTNDISLAQYKVDSLQVAYLKNPSTTSETAYKNAVLNVQKVQKGYVKTSEGTLAHHFIKATDRYNAPEVAKNSRQYLDGVVTHFFDKIDFSNTNLYNSSFLIDRIADYVFYMNYSENVDTQKKLYQKAAGIAIGKVSDMKFKADVIEFLISQFAAVKNADMVDFLFANHFDKLPKENQNTKFKEKTLSALGVAIGRIAPDFSWEENGKQMSLSSLKDGLNYLLIFYSTECPHCISEVPKVYEFLKGKTKTKVVAFAMESSDKTWLGYQKTLPGWHHVLGLGKWENTTARTYQINSTPTYFVLGMDKKIIANPDKLEDLKLVLDALN